MGFSKLKKSFELGIRRVARPLVELGRPHNNLRERNFDESVALGVPRRHCQPLCIHKKRLRNDLARSKVNMRITQYTSDKTGYAVTLKASICAHSRKELATTLGITGHKAQVVAARERRLPFSSFQPLNKSVRRACSPQMLRRASSCGGNTRVFPDPSPKCQNDFAMSLGCAFCYGITLDVPISDLAVGWMEKRPWLRFEITCEGEGMNGCPGPWRFMVPIEIKKTDYSSSVEIDEGTWDVITQGGDEEVPSDGFPGYRPPLRVEPADIVIQHQPSNALLA